MFFMKFKFAFFSICWFVLGVVPCSVHAYVNRDVAILGVMNKAAGKVQNISVPVGETVNFEKVAILVRTCKQTDPFDAQDFFAFIEVSKTGEGKIFSNWLSHNEPGYNTVQNSDYDIWLVGCASDLDVIKEGEIK